MLIVRALFLAGVSLSLHAAPAQWTGFYLGINSGYAWGETQAHLSIAIPSERSYFGETDQHLVEQAADHDLDAQGYTGGLQLGYNQCWNCGLLIGIETDMNALLLTRSHTVHSPYPNYSGVSYRLHQHFSTDWLYTLRPRIGFAYRRLLTFATGGLTLTDLNYKQTYSDDYLSITYPPTHDVDFSASKSTLSVGWSVGGGLEYLLGKRFSTSLSYLYTRFETLSLQKKLIADYEDGYIATNTFHNSAPLSTNLLRLSLNWHL
jgi:outer membrane immunogenic protein